MNTATCSSKSFRKDLKEMMCVCAGQLSFLWLCAVVLTQFLCPLLDKLCAIPFICLSKVKVTDSVFMSDRRN